MKETITLSSKHNNLVTIKVSAIIAIDDAINYSGQDNRVDGSFVYLYGTNFEVKESREHVLRMINNPDINQF